jgi:hypothetical protein
MTKLCQIELQTGGDERVIAMLDRPHIYFICGWTIVQDNGCFSVRPSWSGDLDIDRLLVTFSSDTKYVDVEFLEPLEKSSDTIIRVAYDIEDHVMSKDDTASFCYSIEKDLFTHFNLGANFNAFGFQFHSFPLSIQ